MSQPKIVVQFRADGLIDVTAGAERYVATETHFRVELLPDGMRPVMDITIPLGDIPLEQPGPQGSGIRTLDDLDPEDLR